MHRKTMLKGTGIAVLVALLFLAVVPPARALEIRDGERIEIGEGEVIEDDLIVAAETFILNGTIRGDLSAMGLEIIIGPTGVVEGDLLAAGQRVRIEGTVMDDARITGMALELAEGAQVGDDVIAAGYSLETRSRSTISGTLLYAGAQALLAGAVGEDVRTASGGLELQGRVEGDVDANVGDPEEKVPFSPTQFFPDAPAVPSVAWGLTVGPEAHIAGNLNYSATKAITLPTEAVAGEVDYHQEIRPVTPAEAEEPQKPPRSEAVEWLVATLRRLATLILVGLVLAWLLPGLLRKGADALQQSPLLGSGLGVLSLPALIFALTAITLLMVLLAIILGTLSLGGLVWTVIICGFLLMAVLIVGFILAAVFIAKILVGYLGGRLLLSRIKPEWAGSRIWPTLIGVLLVGLLASLPYVGWLLDLLVAILGLGALGLLLWWALRRPAPLAPVVPPPAV